MEKSFRRLLNKPNARQAFVEAECITAVAHQFRVLRQQRGWTQAQLARRLNTTQAAVSRLEDASYGKYNIRTLIDAAHTFEVALQIRFVSVVDQFVHSRQVAQKDLEVISFSDEALTVGFCEVKPAVSLKQFASANPSSSEVKKLVADFVLIVGSGREEQQFHSVMIDLASPHQIFADSKDSQWPTPLPSSSNI